MLKKRVIVDSNLSSDSLNIASKYTGISVEVLIPHIVSIAAHHLIVD